MNKIVGEREVLASDILRFPEIDFVIGIHGFGFSEEVLLSGSELVAKPKLMYDFGNDLSALSVTN